MQGISISIIIPVYNVELYVKRCIESVIEQDNAKVDIECIIVDDCGQDNSINIVRQLIAEYQGSIRFSIIEHNQNRGLSVARNTGILKAVGDYIMFMDSDDYLQPNSIQYFIDNLHQYTSIDIIIGNAIDCRTSNHMINDLDKPLLMTDRDQLFQQMLCHKIYLCAWNKLIRRDIIINNHICFEEGILYEDRLWSYHLFSCISSVLLLPRITYIYEFNRDSIVNTVFSSGKADKAIWSYIVFGNKMLDCPPDSNKFHHNMTVDYLLFISYYMMNGVDLSSHFKLQPVLSRHFLTVRFRLLLRALSSGRFLLSSFLLLLFSPFCYIQKLRLFRHHYKRIESIVSCLCHKTDFLHSSKMYLKKPLAIVF